MDDQTLIKSLVADLKPVDKPASRVILFSSWLAGSCCLVAGEFYLTGGIRPAAWYQLTHTPRFAVETLIAALIFIFAGYFSTQMASPDASRSRLQIWIAPASLFIFGILIIYGLWNPSLIPSESHQRYFCEIEALIFGFLPAFFLFRIIRGGAPTQPGWAGALALLASVGLPMAVMQVGCMYSPAHVLIHHIIPLLVLFGVGFKLGSKWLTWF